MCFLNCKYSSITAHISNNVLVMKTKSLAATWHVIWSTWNSINYIYLHEHDTVLLKLLFVRAVTRYAAIWTRRGSGLVSGEWWVAILIWLARVVSFRPHTTTTIVSSDPGSRRINYRSNYNLNIFFCKCTTFFSKICLIFHVSKNLLLETISETWLLPMFIIPGQDPGEKKWWDRLRRQ